MKIEETSLPGVLPAYSQNPLGQSWRILGDVESEDGSGLRSPHDLGAG